MLGLSLMNAIIFDVVQVLLPLLLGPSQIGVTSHAMHACNTVLLRYVKAASALHASNGLKIYSQYTRNGNVMVLFKLHILKVQCLLLKLNLFVSMETPRSHVNNGANYCYFVTCFI